MVVVEGVGRGLMGLECQAEGFGRVPRLWGLPMVLERRRDSAEVPWERPPKTRPVQAP